VRFGSRGCPVAIFVFFDCLRGHLLARSSLKLAVAIPRD
jgi:hypothetical protein